MPNTVYGPYSTTSWVNGTTAANATNMNHLETQASIALNGFNGDLLTPFVLSGIVASKDGTIANQLDVTSGRAYLKMSDNTVGLIATVASTASQFLTTTPSTTYYLFLKTDGTWQWSTTSTGPTNSLQICHATTDGSGNINVVTDDRITNTSLLPGAVGLLVGNGDVAIKSQHAPINGLTLLPQYHPAGTAYGILLQTWDGATANNTLSIGSNVASAYTYFGARGNLAQINQQATVGALGAPAVVAKVDDQAVTVTTEVQIGVSITAPADAWYRVGYTFNYVNPTPQKVIARFAWTDPSASGATSNWFVELLGGLLLNGSQATATGNNQIVACAPACFRAKSGTNIGVYFRDPGGTPNDKVSIIVERLS